LIDSSRIAVIGLSNGGGFAPMAANGTPVRGYVVARIDFFLECLGICR
jgi:cephalosporin-C deacetylase-like acetyl esterase